jgi:outer membrane receptor protein involved in Fe transport
MVFPVYFVNGFHARTRGLEGTLDWRPGVRFGMSVTHSLFHMSIEPDPGRNGSADVAAADAPTYQLVVRPHFTLMRHLGLDGIWYHVDDLPHQDAPAYDRVDLRLGWMPTHGFEISGGVQNLLHDREFEFGSVSGTTVASPVRRTLYGKVTLKL